MHLLSHVRATIASILIGSMLAACSGQQTAIPSDGFRTIASGPIYSSRSAQCGGDLARKAQVIAPQYCVNATPDPSYTNNWLMQLDSVGNVRIVYGNSSATYHGGSIKACVTSGAKELAAAAASLVSGLKAQQAAWINGPNAAAIEALLAGYAAGEVGAAATVAGVLALGDAALIAVIVAGAGLTLVGLFDLLDCATNGS
jgi:hypothetical protein